MDKAYITSPPPGEVGRGLGGSLLSTTYFGPVQWYSKLRHCMGSVVYIEACESFVKQTYRNRCIIATANGTQQLTIPICHGSSLITDITISDQANWRHLHWQALLSAYGESPFFEYYQDDIRPFFFDEGPSSPYHTKNLFQFNLLTTRLICRLIDIDIDLQLTTSYTPPLSPPHTPALSPSNTPAPHTPAPAPDHRYTIRPKNPPTDPDFTPLPYYQVYRQRHGFLPNMSILDLLFNEGPQSILFL